MIRFPQVPFGSMVSRGGEGRLWSSGDILVISPDMGTLILLVERILLLGSSRTASSDSGLVGSLVPATYFMPI